MPAQPAVRDRTANAGAADAAEVAYTARTTTVAAPALSDATVKPSATVTAPDEESRKPRQPWFSGFCGPGPECNDERHRNKAGEIVRHCKYVTENGEKIAQRFLYCACVCHTDPDRAGQALLEGYGA